MTKIINIWNWFCDVIAVFYRYYHAPTLSNGSFEAIRQLQSPADLLSGNRSEVTAGSVLNALPESLIHCTREMPLLCLLLMLGTLWMGYTLYQFKRRYEKHCSVATLWDKSLENFELHCWVGSWLRRPPGVTGTFESGSYKASFLSKLVL